MQYLLKQSEMENKEQKQKEQKGENPSIDQNCNSERGKRGLSVRRGEEARE